MMVQKQAFRPILLPFMHAKMYGPPHPFDDPPYINISDIPLGLQKC